MSLEECSNCGLYISDKITAYVFKDHCVCPACYKILRKKGKGKSMFKFFSIVLLLGVLAGGAATAYGYYGGDNEVGGYGLFIGAGSLVALVLLGVLRMFKGKSPKEVAQSNYDRDREVYDPRSRQRSSSRY